MDHSSTEQRLLSRREVATLIGIPLSTLKYWAWADTAPDGFPKPVRVGRLAMYPAHEVREWVEVEIAKAQASARDVPTRRVVAAKVGDRDG